MQPDFGPSLNAKKIIGNWMEDVWRGRPLPKFAQDFPFASTDIPFLRGGDSVAFWCRIVFLEHRTFAGNATHYEWVVFISEFIRRCRGTTLVVYRESPTDYACAGRLVCPRDNWVWPLLAKPRFARNFVLWGLMFALDAKLPLYATQGGLVDARGRGIVDVSNWWDVLAPDQNH